MREEDVHAKAMVTESATGHAGLAMTLSRSFECCSQELQTWSESSEGIGRCDLSRMRRLLQCRLTWYGFRSVEVGPFRGLTEDTLFVDLLHACGVVLCRVEVDRQSGVISPSAGHALSRLLISLRGATANGSPMAASVCGR